VCTDHETVKSPSPMIYPCTRCSRVFLTCNSHTSAKQNLCLQHNSQKLPLWGNSHHTIVWTLDRMPSRACHMLAFEPAHKELAPWEQSLVS
jgi:hypothetical protein